MKNNPETSLQRTSFAARRRQWISALALAAAASLPSAGRAQASGPDQAAASGDNAADATEARYRLGLYQRETGSPYSAIETLEGLLTANPTLNRARLELAVAYYRTLNYAKARAQAELVLAGSASTDRKSVV